MHCKEIKLSVGLGVILLSVGCSSLTAIEIPEATPSGETLTYYEHVKPIVDENCVGCHTKGQIGPFSLNTYDDVKSHGLVSKAYVTAKVMPPWPPDSTCNTYKYDRSLTDKQIDTFASWVDGGMLEGDPATTPQTRNNNQDGLSRVDLTLTTEEYTPQQTPDDYRCFLLRWPEEYTERKYVTGFNAIPGDIASAHHIVAFLASAAQVSEYERLDANEAGAGYTCFGTTGGPVIGSVGAWAPGGSGRDLSDGIGILIEPGALIVLQVHYNTLTSVPTMARTSIDLKIDDIVEHDAITLPWTDPLWWFGDSMTIPAGLSEVTHSFSKDPTSFYTRGYPIDIYQTSLHMHMLGTKSSMVIERKNGTTECLISMPRWDFNWQGLYQFSDGPIRVNPGDKITIECTWDNSAENQPRVDGQLLPPRDVGWGENSTDEMCLGSIFGVIVK